MPIVLTLWTIIIIILFMCVQSVNSRKLLRQLLYAVVLQKKIINYSRYSFVVPKLNVTKCALYKRLDLGSFGELSLAQLLQKSLYEWINEETAEPGAN